MKRILLVCSAGMSTSLLVVKMQDEAALRGMDVDIQAHGNSDIQRLKSDFDVCLVGPQIKFSIDQIAADLAPMPVEVIDMRIYGLADGAGALDQALLLIK